MKDRLSTAQPIISTLLRLGLSVVFFLSGYAKIIDTEETVRSVRAYDLLPQPVVRPFGYALPMIELGVAVLLLVGLATRASAVLSGVLMIMFLIGISTAWARGLRIDCGCFGSGGVIDGDPVPGYIRDLARDTGFLLMAVLLARWPRSRASLDGVLGLTSPPAREAEA